MDYAELLLKASEQLYTHLEKVPEEKDRDEYINSIEKLINARGVVIEQLQKIPEDPLKNHELMSTLIELDKGIRERLQKVYQSIKDDIQNLQKMKQSERHYINPYGATYTMDGTYYDQKK